MHQRVWAQTATLRKLNNMPSSEISIGTPSTIVKLKLSTNHKSQMNSAGRKVNFWNR